MVAITPGWLWDGLTGLRQPICRRPGISTGVTEAIERGDGPERTRRMTHATTTLTVPRPVDDRPAGGRPRCVRGAGEERPCRRQPAAGRHTARAREEAVEAAPAGPRIAAPRPAPGCGKEQGGRGRQGPVRRAGAREAGSDLDRHRS